jgi:hypothetical protein
MGTRFEKFLLVFLWVPLGVACAESERSPDDDSVSTGNAEVNEIITAYCESVRSCCRVAGFSTEPLTGCEAFLPRTEVLRTVLSGKAVFREAERSQCLQQIREMGQTCVEPDNPACRSMINGTLGEGATCERVEECQHGEDGVACVSITVGNEEPPPGTCRRLSAGQLGSPCFRTIDADHYGVGHSTSEANPVLVTCDRRNGLFCDDETSTCQPLLSPGQACGYEGCPNSYYCDGTCLPQLPAGSSCQFYGQCAAGLECVNDVCVTAKITNGDLCEGDLG